MIETWSCGPADDAMPEEILVSVHERVRRHPWWCARVRLALSVLQKNGVLPPAHVVDVGCGWGTNLEALEAAGYRVTGIDISPQILARIDRPDRRLIEADLTQDLPARAGAEQADALLALDVIEHIDDDRGAVRRMAQMLRTGGLAMLSVPALPELFSEFDRIQGHRRRYTPETLRDAISGSGLTVQSVFWWGAWMVPVLRRMRTRTHAPRTYADYLRLPPWPGPQVMRLAYAVEEKLALAGRLKTGTSLVAVAVRESAARPQ